MSKIDISAIAEYEAQNKDVLTGSACMGACISIADGATVTLDDIIIADASPLITGASITCKGDAHLILKGINCIKCAHNHLPGIFIPEGKTLTLEGSGSLSICGKGNGAGIGGGYQIPCGNIHIKGGFIVAKGGTGAAGIGGGYYAGCGYIRIDGGTITATGGAMAAAIGSGLNGKCGDITISDRVIYLTARKGECGDFTVEDIGRGAGGSCGSVDNQVPEERMG